MLKATGMVVEGQALLQGKLFMMDSQTLKYTPLTYIPQVRIQSKQRRWSRWIKDLSSGSVAEGGGSVSRPYPRLVGMPKRPSWDVKKAHSLMGQVVPGSRRVDVDAGCNHDRGTGLRSADSLWIWVRIECGGGHARAPAGYTPGVTVEALDLVVEALGSVHQRRLPAGSR
ncbi:hypothetical protein KM043_004763 [Ampulex compressa]|nr:hypothetical protein KM043_004763 [Ampulex compressa]